MAKQKKASKAKVENKGEKAKVENKATKAKSIDWASQPEKVTVIGLGGKHLVKDKEYPTTKATAKILVEKGAAKLK